MMGKQLKMLRKTLDLTQQEFADRIGIKRNSVASYETKDDREPVGAVVSLICREFSVNEEWLRTGEGDMFITPPKNDLIAKAAVLLGQKDPVFEAFVDTYSKLDPANRKVLIEWGLDFLNNLKQRSEDI